MHGPVIKTENVKTVSDRTKTGPDRTVETLTITEPPFCNWTLFDFSCTFPVLSPLQSYRDLREMTLILCLDFYLKVFFPLFIIMAFRMFWTDLFCKFVATRRAAEFKVRRLETRLSGSNTKYWLRRSSLSSLIYGRYLPWPCTTEKTGHNATRLKPKFALLYMFRAEIEIVVWLLRVFILFPWRSWALATLLWPLPGLVYSI